MYQFSYSQVLADSPADARAQERRALEHAIGLLRAAEGHPHGAPEQQQALDFVVQLWSLFITDLADPGNDLAPETRGTLMSIGLWIMGEALRIEKGESRGLDAIADVCGIIRDGLR